MPRAHFNAGPWDSLEFDLPSDQRIPGQIDVQIMGQFRDPTAEKLCLDMRITAYRYVIVSSKRDESGRIVDVYYDHLLPREPFWESTI